MFGMFRSARIKLMLWYLLTILSISALFSTALYFSFTAELERSFMRAKVQILAEERDIKLPLHWRQQIDRLEDPRLQQVVKNQLLNEDLEVAKQAILWQLLMINGILALFAIFAGWLLAGKTLAPIQKVHEDQKQFIADASHELRTPITALRAALEVFQLKKKHTKAEIADLVSRCLYEAESLQYLVDKLLRLTLYQGTRRQMTLSTFVVEKVLKQVLKTLDPLISRKKLSVSLVGNGGELQADREKVKELLGVLLENAVKYTKEGSITISLERKKRSVRLAIKDTGIGISKETLPRIFDRFYRADPCRTRGESMGYGLGLAVAQEIVDMHDGTLTTESEVGVGSTFVVTLPIKQKRFSQFSS